MVDATATTSSPADQPRRDLVIALVNFHPKSLLLLHAARKRAREINGTWRAVHIDGTEGREGKDEGSHEWLLRLFAIAEQMGGEVQQLQAEAPEHGLRAIMETEKDRLAWMVIGSEPSQKFRHWQKHYSAWGRAIRNAQRQVPVEAIALGTFGYKQPVLWLQWRSRWRHFAYALMAVCIAYLVAVLLETTLSPALFRINLHNISMLFMIACAFTAGRYGLLPGLLAALLGAITYNYYYVPPYHNLEIFSVTKGLSMALFFFAAALIAIFTGQARLYGERSERRERSTQALFTLYQIASTAFSRQEALETLREKLSDMLNIEVAFFLPSLMWVDRIELAVPTDVALDEQDSLALQTCWTDMRTTGLATTIHPNASWRFKPMVAPNGPIGVFAVRPRQGAVLELWQARLLMGIADQTALIVEHFELARSMEATRIREEREKLRSMLLSSVSHDLKTPLAGIIGSLSVHHSVGDRLTPERRAELLNDALEEAQRLDSFITNILDITRLESGKIKFHPDWHDMNGVVRQVVKRLHHRLHNRKIRITPCADTIEVFMDVVMTEQILQNLLDNACKYTAAGVGIDITISLDESTGLKCEIRDYGNGIPQDKFHTVFDKYARLHKEDTQIAGTGLGLSICKAVLEAQGGWITAANHPEGGAAFTFCFPKWRIITVDDSIDNAA